MSRFRLHTLVALVLSALPLTAMAIVVAIVDPYQLFHRQPFAQSYYWQTNNHTERQRLHAFGLIYSHIAAPMSDYDGILAGSSRTVGTSTELIASKLGLVRVADLSLIGSRGYENRIVVERALETGRVKAVVWEIDFWFIDAHEAPTMIPEYLQSSTRLDDIRYCFTPSVFGDAIDLMLGRTGQHWTNSLERLNDPSRHFTAGRFQQASSAIASRLHPAPRTARTRRSESTAPIPRLDRDIIEVVERHPDVQFYLLFPVVPTLLYAAEPPDRIPAFLRGRRYLVERFRNAPNVHIFAFDTDPLIAGNLANFSDPNHCGHGADEYLFESMATGRNQLTMGSIDAYEQAFIDLVDNCRVMHDPATAIGYMPR